MTTLYDLTPKAADGAPYPLAQHRGQIVLVVNTASKCGFTRQYGELEDLWRRHRDEGFVVLGFPCNQFGRQEPGDAAEIARFCTLTYDVSFPLLAKVEVNGAGADPVFVHLKREKAGLFGMAAIKWNFTKFLVGRDGRVIRRYSPIIRPIGLEADVAGALGSTPEH